MPNPNRSCLGISLALLGTGLSALFLSNLTFGIVEIPDNLPSIGNLDEVLASAILFSCLSYLGINVVPTHWSQRVAPAPRRSGFYCGWSAILPIIRIRTVHSLGHWQWHLSPTVTRFAIKCASFPPVSHVA